MRGIRPRHVRTRLTLWYLSVLAGVLLLYVAGTMTFFFFSLRKELDSNLMQDFETIEGLIELGTNGRIQLEEYDDQDIQLTPEQELLMEIWSPEGELIFRSEPLGDQQLGDPPELDKMSESLSPFTVTLENGNLVRMLIGRETVDGKQIVIRLAHNEERFWQEFRDFFTILLLGLPLALLIAGAGGYALARRTLAPIDKMAQRAQRISAERLNERLPIENPVDELGHLGQTFNAMLQRIELSFEQLQRFATHASHELRTPLTAIRSVGEVGLQNCQDETHYREVIGSMLEEVDRLTRLIDKLLMLSRANAGGVLPRVEKFLSYFIESMAFVQMRKPEPDSV